MRRAVFIDRDGVINDALVVNGKPYPPTSLAEFKYRSRVSDALSLLSNAGFLNIIVTNQPDVRTGKQHRRVVDSFHKKIKYDMPVHDIFACFHIDEDACACRKPKPGLLLQAAETWQIDLANSHMVGDRWRDIDAGKNAGCTTYWLPGGYDEQEPVAPDFIADSLWGASKLIVRALEAED